MAHAPIELGAIVAAGIAHDGIIVGNGSRERIERGRGSFVRRIALAGLERAPRSLQPQEAVTRAKGGALCWLRRYIDLRFQLGHDRPAVVAIRREIVP